VGGDGGGLPKPRHVDDQALIADLKLQIEKLNCDR
jgi:hypothetical protein